MALQSTFPNPVMRALKPCLLAKALPWFFCYHILCSSEACHHRPAAAAPPGPSVSRRLSSELDWQRTAMTPSQRLMADTAIERLTPFKTCYAENNLILSCFIVKNHIF